MKNINERNVRSHQTPDKEKIWVVGYYPVRRHSRVLYVPLDYKVCQLHDVRKGDTVKVAILEVLRAPRPDESESEEEGEL